MNFFISILISFIYVVPAFSQKDTSQRFDAEKIEQLYIYTDEVFKIKLKTSETHHIILTSHTEGEYFNDIALETEMFQNKMILTSKFRKILQSGYDKLSAHKVFSVEITLEIPKNLQVFIKSNIASVTGEGTFKNLQIELKSGYCRLEYLEGNAVINTYSGSIWIAAHDANINASSRNGTVKLPPPTEGSYQVNLTSINGDISVVKN
jgi:hypothetical protein